MHQLIYNRIVLTAYLSKWWGVINKSMVFRDCDTEIEVTAVIIPSTMKEYLFSTIWFAGTSYVMSIVIQHYTQIWWWKSETFLQKHNTSGNVKMVRHYSDVIMGAMASQITSLTIVCSTVYSGADQRKHQSPRHRTSRGEFTGHRWIPRTKGQ